jgi:pyoverdine/dityrosine biosynthesis protein Dit1
MHANSAYSPAGLPKTGAGLEEQILRIIMGSRRALPGDGCVDTTCPECLAPHLDLVRAFVAAGEPIHLILPAFPAKSPNLRNVLGTLPDMAEQLALVALQRICDRVRAVYTPGARLTICSDGRVFTDLVRLRDEDITEYQKAVHKLIADLGAADINLFDLDEAFATKDFDELRRLLLQNHASPLEEVRQRIKDDVQKLHAFNGIARFLLEDRVVLEPTRSKNSLRKECSELSYHVVQRSMAWSDLIRSRFPRSVRLSIHAQPSHAEKIGVYLVETRDNWLTPWHGVAVEAGGRYVLMKRHQAEALGAALAYRDGRPSHFVLPGSHNPLTEEPQPCFAHAS